MTAGPPEESPPTERRSPTLLEQMGGVPGIIASTIPVAVFVVVNIVSTLQPALIAALAAGVVIAIWRLANGKVVSLREVDARPADVAQAGGKMAAQASR